MAYKKICVLLAAHIGEPVGGISIAYQDLLASSYSHILDVNIVGTSKGKRSFHDRGNIKISNWLTAIANVWRFAIALWRARPQIVHLGSAPGPSFAKHSVMALIAHLMGVVVIMEVHCSIWKLLPERSTLWKRYVLFIFKRTDAIVTLSREWDALLEWVPEVKINYIPNAINTQQYIKLLRPRRNQANSVNLLFLGHIGIEKGCFDLLSAVEQLKARTSIPFCLQFVGETLRAGEKEHLRAEVEVRGIQTWVQINEPEYAHKKITRLAMSDVFVLPSYHEGMPMSVIEAMAAGLPVVASRVGGIPEQVIHDRTGLIVDPGDVRGLADALLRLIENKGERISMGKAGRQRAIEVYDIEKKAGRLISLYQELLQSC